MLAVAEFFLCCCVARTDFVILSELCHTAGSAEGTCAFWMGSEKIKDVENCSKHVTGLIGHWSGVERPG